MGKRRGVPKVLERGKRDEPVNVSLAELPAKAVNEAFSRSTNGTPLSQFQGKWLSDKSDFIF